MAYVLKLTDHEYPASFLYIGKGSILGHGSYGLFLEDSVFETEEEAKAHIQTCLASGWYRTDITAANFELVEANLYPDLNTGFYYTKDEYERFKNLN
jgi:hypothetical protein